MSTYLQISKTLFLVLMLLALLSCSGSSQHSGGLAVRKEAKTLLIPYRQNGLWGFADSTATLVIKPVYDKVEPFEYGVARVKKGEKWGIIDARGKRLTRLRYKEIEKFKDGTAVVSTGNRDGVINTEGKKIISLRGYGLSRLEGYSREGVPPFYVVSDFKVYSPDWVKKWFGIRVFKERYGLLDEKGKILLPVKYNRVFYIGEGYTGGSIGDSIYDYIDRNGHPVKGFTDSNSWINYFNNGLARAGKNGKAGIVDNVLKEVIPFQYEAVGDFSKGLIPVKKNGLWGYINLQNQVVIPFRYHAASAFDGGAAIVSMEGYKSKGLINEEGEPLTEFIYNEIKYYPEDDVYVLTKGDTREIVVVDKANKRLFQKKEYRVVAQPVQGLTKVEKDGRYGYINSNGKVVVPIEFISVTKFNEGLSIVLKEDKWGVYDTAGNIVVPVVYQSGSIFKDGFFIVEKGGKKGLIDRRNEVIIPFIYSFLYSLNQELLLAEDKDGEGNKKYQIIDKTGRQVTQLKYEGYNFPDSYGLSSKGKRVFMLKEGGVWSVMEATGDTVSKLVDLPKGYTLATPLPKSFKGSKYILIHNTTTQQYGFFSLDGLKFFDE